MPDRSFTAKYPAMETTWPNTPGSCIAMFTAP